MSNKRTRAASNKKQGYQGYDLDSSRDGCIVPFVLIIGGLLSGVIYFGIYFV